MVFDMISNAPGVLNSSVQFGRLQDLSTGGTSSEPNPTLGLNPTVYDFEPPQVTQWNARTAEEAVQQLHVRPGLRRLQVG